jgi:hypothetical protein
MASGDKRGNLHMIHHWQDGDHNRYYNGGHSFSRDGTHWTFSEIPAYTKNISWSDGTWTVMGRRERPGLLLDTNWSTPRVLFTSVVEPNGPDSWMQSQPVRSTSECASGWTGPTCNEPAGGGACESDESCNLNGSCQDGKCHCDIEWSGESCGVLALLPAKKSGGYRRQGFNGWGGNPFWDKTDQKYHVFTVEMTNHCTINDYITNSQIVHAVSADAEGPYQLAPIAGGNPYDLQSGVPAPNASVLVPAFAHAPHATRDLSTGALVIVYEGRHPRDLVPPAKQKRCHYEPPQVPLPNVPAACHAANAASVTVSGAGCAACNGLYTRVQTSGCTAWSRVQGRQELFYKDAAHQIYASARDGKWRIAKSGENKYYVQNGSTAFVGPPGTPAGWVAEPPSGKSPPPTLNCDLCSHAPCAGSAGICPPQPSQG